VRASDPVRTSAADRIERRARAVEEGSVGLPLGVQIVGRPWREDLVLALMIAVEDEARRSPDFPVTPV
jgi:fatty acid amide hydrolase